MGNADFLQQIRKRDLIQADGSAGCVCFEDHALSVCILYCGMLCLNQFNAILLVCLQTAAMPYPCPRIAVVQVECFAIKGDIGSDVEVAPIPVVATVVLRKALALDQLALRHATDQTRQKQGSVTNTKLLSGQGSSSLCSFSDKVSRLIDIHHAVICKPISFLRR